MDAALDGVRLLARRHGGVRRGGPAAQRGGLGARRVRRAGAEAAERCRGPGPPLAELCDALHLMDGATLARRAIIRDAN